MPSGPSTRAKFPWGARTIPTSLAAVTLTPLASPASDTGENGSRRPLASYAKGGSARPAPGSRGRTAAAPGAAGAAGVAAGVGGLGGAAGGSVPLQPPSKAAAVSAPKFRRSVIGSSLIGSLPREPARGAAGEQEALVRRAGQAWPGAG